MRGTTDLYGEIDTHGLELQLVGDAQGKQAEWLIDRCPMSLIGKASRMYDETFIDFGNDRPLLKKVREAREKELQQEASRYVLERSASLIELQDVAVLLKKSQNKVTVGVI